MYGYSNYSSVLLRDGMFKLSNITKINYADEVNTGGIVAMGYVKDNFNLAGNIPYEDNLIPGHIEFRPLHYDDVNTKVLG